MRELIKNKVHNNILFYLSYNAGKKMSKQYNLKLFYLTCY